MSLRVPRSDSRDSSPGELLAPGVDACVERWRGSEGADLREALMEEIEAARTAGSGALVRRDLRGATLVDFDLSGLDLSGCDLTRAELSRANLAGARLFAARLEGATLFRANLDGCELTGADLTDANLQGASLVGAGLGTASLVRASLVEADLSGATLTDADLTKADLRLACLEGARALEANLEGAVVERANLSGAVLDRARVRGARFDGADLRRTTLRQLRDYRRATWLGVDVREIDFTGAYLCRVFIRDQNFIHEFRHQNAASELVYWVWRVTSDCGRSILRWALCTAVLLLMFASLYDWVGVDYGRYETSISPLYFSVVTMTTLGYGDIVPKTTMAQACAMLQVITGYVMLGGLLSIFSNKMGRRAD